MTLHFLVTLNWYFWYFPTTPFPPPWVVVPSFKYPLTQLLGAPQSSTPAWCMTVGPRALLNKNPLAVCSKTVSCEWFGVSPLLSQNVGESSRCGSFRVKACATTWHMCFLKGHLILLLWALSRAKHSEECLVEQSCFHPEGPGIEKREERARY